MGVTIKAKGFRHSMDMGYITFMHLRTDIAVYLGLTEKGSMPYSDQQWYSFVGKVSTALRDGNISVGTARFLMAPDAEHRLAPVSCEGFLKDIGDMENDRRYGYVWTKHNRIKDFKDILGYCVKNRKCLMWY